MQLLGCSSHLCPVEKRSSISAFEKASLLRFLCKDKDGIWNCTEVFGSSDQNPEQMLQGTVVNLIAVLPEWKEGVGGGGGSFDK